MVNVSVIFFVFFAIAIFWQDLKYRAVNVWAVVAVFISLFVKLILEETAGQVLVRIFLNTVVTGTVLAGLFIYMKFRSKHSASGEKLFFGKGDVFTLFAVSPAFDLFGFLLFLIASGIIILVLWTLLTGLRLVKTHTVPYAGALCALLAVIVAGSRYGLFPLGIESLFSNLVPMHY
ncbi:MAG: hypothetical protein PHQ65_08405 [Bacteroidales bacterium]|nr:hypothetical protein [Bacteroidales bacterium]MDD3665272.1 hypothetical protein [Bacteroidales bacterium]